MALKPLRIATFHVFAHLSCPQSCPQIFFSLPFYVLGTVFAMCFLCNFHAYVNLACGNSHM